MSGREIAWFLMRVVLLFCLLQLSWPLLGRWYEAAFRGVTSMVFESDDADREVTFRPHDSRAGDTRVEIVNRKLMASDGSGPVRHMDFGVRSLGWNPTTLFCALVLATPMAWGRRWRALAVGATGLQVLVLGVLAMSLWLESSFVGLVDLSPTWQGRMGTLKQALVDATRLAAPVLLWVVVIYRRPEGSGEGSVVRTLPRSRATQR